MLHEIDQMYSYNNSKTTEWRNSEGTNDQGVWTAGTA